MDDEQSPGPLDEDLSRGLVHIHEKLGKRILEHDKLAAHVYALTEVLIASGALKLRALDQRKADDAKAMADEATSRWDGARVLDDTRDKYTVTPAPVDCASRVSVCKAACCRLSFYLSKQDLGEHTVRWDVARPYHIARRADGWCVHCDPATRACGVHERRPLVCRRYDCREDGRIWQDFEQVIPTAEVEALPPPA